MIIDHDIAFVSGLLQTVNWFCCDLNMLNAHLKECIVSLDPALEEQNPVSKVRTINSNFKFFKYVEPKRCNYSPPPRKDEGISFSTGTQSLKLLNEKPSAARKFAKIKIIKIFPELITVDFSVFMLNISHIFIVNNSWNNFGIC